MKKIPLVGKYGKGKYILVDDEDFEEMNKYWWHLSEGYPNGYKKTKVFNFRINRLLMNCPKGLVVDHIDHNPLNNQKYNLRICTRQQNSQNVSKMKKKTSSIYKGVHFRKSDKRWAFAIEDINEKKVFNYFKDEHHAALMYDFWATELYGEFALTNFKVVAHSLLK